MVCLLCLVWIILSASLILFFQKEIDAKKADEVSIENKSSARAEISVATKQVFKRLVTWQMVIVFTMMPPRRAPYEKMVLGDFREF